MANTIILEEPSVNTLMPTWTGLRLQRGPNATNIGAFATVADTPYVADVTRYVINDPIGAPSDWYRTARYGPGVVGAYSPAWPVEGASATTRDGERRSLKSCRRMLARRLGSLVVATTTADGNDSGTSFVSSTVATVTDPNRYRGWWVMPTDGVSNGDIRTLGDNALNALTGQIVVILPFTSKIYSGTQVEMHKLLPPEERGGHLGLREALNLALGECWVLDRLSLAGLANTVTYDLSTFGDWMDASAVREVYSSAVAGEYALPFGPYLAHNDANLVNLDVTGLGAGGTVNVELTRPGDTYMKVNGVWTDNQRGFVNDTDESLFQPGPLVEVALAHCYQSLAEISIGPEQARFQGLAVDQRTRVNIMKYRSLPHPPDRIAQRGYGGWNIGGSYDAKSYWAR